MATDAATFGLTLPTAPQATFDRGREFGVSLPAQSASGDAPSMLKALWSGMKQGFVDPFYGTAQLGARMASPGSPDFPAMVSREEAISSVDKMTREREQAYKASAETRAHPTASGLARFGGEVLSPPNLAMTLLPGGQATLPARLGMTALSGAGAAATEPVVEGDYWHSKMEQVGGGAAAGALGSAAVRGVGGLVAPAMTGAAKSLVNEGVTLTPGQMAGGSVRRAEEAFKSFPILGEFIRGAERRSLNSFNTTTVNQALDPIGVRLPKGVKAGHEAVSEAATIIGDAYDKLLPNVTFKVDHDFVSGMKNLRELAGEMPPAQAEQFNNIIQNRVLHRLSETGQMDGNTLKQVESELWHLASSYRSSSDAAQRQLSTALSETRSLIREALARQNPDAAKDLSNINSSYSMLARVEDAAGRRPVSDGIFTPSDLLAASKKGDASVRKRKFAHGDALFQEFASQAQKVMAGKLPDSGTTERAGWLGLGAAELGAGMMGASLKERAALLAPIAAAPIFTPPGVRAVQHYLTPGATRENVAQMLRSSGHYSAPAFGLLGADAQR